MELLIDIHLTYMKIWNFKKIFVRRTITYSIHFTKITIKLIKGFLKYTLKKILVCIFKNTPSQLKKTLIKFIYNFPKLLSFSQKFRSWIVKTDNLNQVLQTQFIVSFFIRNVLLLILRISLKYSYLRSIFLNEIRLNVFIKTELNRILRELDISKEIEVSTFLLYRNKNLELSDAEEEIYRDLKIFSTES